MAYFANLLSLFVLTTTLMFFFISPSPPVKPQKVDLVVYYKTLSPRCADFIVNYLKLVFQTDLNTIVNLRLVPWVNAKVINGTIYCWVTLLSPIFLSGFFCINVVDFTDLINHFLYSLARSKVKHLNAT
ncbi:hypothetical protein LWI29_010820 [Acer saccharum]|uniref:Uncharacterized protein n=1 Tax=Acer saccharum TaxID=4024 RepID=A0AA39S3G2_ACESA|nr:hypothetical protein LWI29_010820 [Acer saccharum]